MTVRYTTLADCKKAFAEASPREKAQIKEFVSANVSRMFALHQKPAKAAKPGATELPYDGSLWSLTYYRNHDTGKVHLGCAQGLYAAGDQGLTTPEMLAILSLPERKFALMPETVKRVRARNIKLIGANPAMVVRPHSHTPAAFSDPRSAVPPSKFAGRSSPKKTKSYNRPKELPPVDVSRIRKGTKLTLSKPKSK
jgi:hypothetical protein